MSLELHWVSRYENSGAFREPRKFGEMAVVCLCEKVCVRVCVSLFSPDSPKEGKVILIASSVFQSTEKFRFLGFRVEITPQGLCFGML
jgi:hypothetical protein